jgi:hypothetical protein
VTNDRATSFVGGEKIRMRVGHLYHVKLAKSHYARNDVNEARIHLAMDLKVNDWLNRYFPRPTAWEASLLRRAPCGQRFGACVGGSGMTYAGRVPAFITYDTRC